MRRRVIEDPVNHERWLISYADFVTLLFAFFVVMYSISQVNESKYRVLSDSLTDTFNSNRGSPEKSLDPIQIGVEARSNPIHLIDLEDPAIANKDQNAGEAVEPSEVAKDPFVEITESVEELFGELVGSKLINIRGNEEWLEIELSSSLLFTSGDAQLSVPALEILAQIVGVVKTNSNPIRVEGFTDNVPINNARFPSNWELSAARSAAVVQLFVEEGIAPERLAAIGYGEYQPVDTNETPEGRNRNRRIVLMISKTDELRPELEENAVETPSGPADPLQGVEKVELEGGGLLFTNDPSRANLNR